MPMTGPLVFRTSMQRGQLDHLALVVSDLKLTDVAGVAAEALIGLDIYLPRPAELVEVVDVVRSQIDLQRVEELADRHAQGHAFGPVDVEIQPGRICPGTIEQSLQARRSIAPFHDLVADPLQFREPEIAAILDDELEATGRTQAVDRRRTEHRDDRSAHLTVTAFLQFGSYGIARQLRPAAVSKLLEHDVQRAEVGRVGIQEQRLARNADGVLDARQCCGPMLQCGP